MKTETENIKDFFTENRRKILSVKAIEQMADVPRNTLLNVITIGRNIPKAHVEAITRVLEIVGYEPVGNEHRFL